MRIFGTRFYYLFPLVTDMIILIKFIIGNNEIIEVSLVFSLLNESNISKQPLKNRGDWLSVPIYYVDALMRNIRLE